MPSPPLNRILEPFERLLQMRIAFHDTTRSLGTVVPRSRFLHRHRACRRMKARQESACVHFDRNRVQAAAAQYPEGFVKVCPAGLVEVVIPLHRGTTLVGVLFAGPVRGADGVEASARLVAVRRYPLPPAVLAALPALDTEELADRMAVLQCLGREVEDLLARQEAVGSRAQQLPWQIEQYLQRRLAEPVTLVDLAAFLHRSPSRTSHLMRELFGKTFPQLLTELRMGHARELLCNTSLSISQVAAYCGFADPSYFHRLFRRAAGTTPRRYRLAEQGSPEV